MKYNIQKNIQINTNWAEYDKRFKEEDGDIAERPPHLSTVNDAMVLKRQMVNRGTPRRSSQSRLCIMIMTSLSCPAEPKAKATMRPVTKATQERRERS